MDEVYAIAKCPILAGIQAAIEGGFSIAAINSDGIVMIVPYYSRGKYIKEIRTWEDRTSYLRTWKKNMWSIEEWISYFPMIGKLMLLPASNKLAMRLTATGKESRRICVLGSMHSSIVADQLTKERDLPHG